MYTLVNREEGLRRGRLTPACSSAHARHGLRRARQTGKKNALHAAMGCGERKTVTERAARGVGKQLVEGLSNHLVRAAGVSRLGCTSDFLGR